MSEHLPEPEPESAAAGLTAAEQAVPSFEVPAPPDFAASSPTPDAQEPFAAAPVIPPAPEFGDVADAIADVAAPTTRRSASRRRSEEALASPAVRARAIPDPGAPVVRHIDLPSGGGVEVGGTESYRVWGVVIFGGLGALFVGAIGLMVFLAVSA
ncbi:hypothetical protein [uncultured Microbacterium sp.]|uniref:hypothetical protein n=1 Tax=uncultured Microbacterium sp. TaxID=191216 RepID=UPI002630E552|nr:hypothetical protein [uncultured Microbacterium sp.]